MHAHTILSLVLFISYLRAMHMCMYNAIAKTCKVHAVYHTHCSVILFKLAFTLRIYYAHTHTHTHTLWKYIHYNYVHKPAQCMIQTI